jgi:hypothetical protein
MTEMNAPAPDLEGQRTLLACIHETDVERPDNDSEAGRRSVMSAYPNQAKASPTGIAIFG